MSSFVVANLGDAALSIPSGTVNSGGTLSTGGFVWVNNTTGNPITLTLTANMTPFVLIKDIAGNAAAHPITITYSGGIDAGTSVQLITNYEEVWLAWNGTNYSVTGSQDPLVISALSLNPATGLGTTLQLTGAVTGTNSATTYYNILNYTSDSAALTGASSFGIGLNVTLTFGGGTMQGGREAFQSVAILNGATSASNANRNYVGGTFLAVAMTGDGGTNLGAGALGGVFGCNPYFDTRSGATNLLNVSAGEVNSIARIGSSMQYKSLWQLVGGGTLDAVQGSTYDCMLALSAQPGSVGFNDGVLIGAMNGQFPIVTGGNLIRALTGTVTAGIDFSAVTFSGKHFNFGGLTQANNNALAIGGAALTNHYFTAVGNAAAALPPVESVTYALTSNYSNALREFDLWNCDTAATSAFQFYQLTGAASAIKVLSIGIDGTLGVVGTSGTGANTATLTNSPTTGNPTEWAVITFNGNTRRFPLWT